MAFEHGRLGTLMQKLEDSFPDATTDRTDGLKLMLAGGLDPRAGVEHRADTAPGGGSEVSGDDGRVVRARDGDAALRGRRSVGLVAAGRMNCVSPLRR